MVKEQESVDPSTRRLDGHRLSEFIYGTVTGMVAVLGVSSGDEGSWLGAMVVIIAGAVAIWIAHAYAILISKRLVGGRRLEAQDLGEALSGSWPIVSAGILLALPLPAVAVGLWSLGSALWASSLIGILILALAGFLAGVIADETWPRRLLLTALSASLGLAVVVLELALHH